MRKFIQTNAKIDKPKVIKALRFTLVAFYMLVLLSVATSSAPVEAQTTNVVSGEVPENWELTLVAPEGAVFSDVLFASYGTPDNYTLGSCHSDLSVQKVYEVFVGNSSGTIAASNGIFGDPCGGIYKRLQVILVYEYVVPQIVCWDGSVVFNILDCPIEPTPTPTETLTPTPTPTETVSPSPSPSTSEPVQPSPTPTQTSTPQPSPSVTTAQPSPSVTVVPTPQPTVTPDPEPQTPTVEDVLNNLPEGQALSAEIIAELGVDYSELPPDTPVELENGVVLTAEVADAIEIFENPTELLATVFSDPGKALTAIANIGADLPEEVREQAQKAAVPAVIVTQVIAGTASMLMRRI